MPFSRREPRLRDLAAAAGFSQTSLSEVAGVDRSTINRLWVDQDWVGKAQGDTLLRVSGYVPGVGKHFVDSGANLRRKKLDRSFGSVGATVDWEEFDRAVAVRRVDPQYLYTALETTFLLLKGEDSRAVILLRSCWGGGQTRALDIALGLDPELRLLSVFEELTQRADGMLRRLLDKRHSNFNRAIAETVLAHHLGKAGGCVASEHADSVGESARLDDRGAFLLRGTYMGLLRKSDDLEVAKQYDDLVNNNGVLRSMELWAFPTWTADANMGSDFEVAPSLSLKRTGIEVVEEVAHYNDAYVWYLASTFIPLALTDIDATFGGHLPALRRALLRRAEGMGLEEVQHKCRDLALALEVRD